jgi:hypothetical protein
MEEIQTYRVVIPDGLEPCAMCGVEIKITRKGYCLLCAERLESRELVFD